MRVSVIIPNWRGKKLLEKNLPKLFSAISYKQSLLLRNQPSAISEVIVVDDASPDDSNKFLEKNYPQIRIVKHKKNLGFAVACNSGVKAAQGEVVVLLNLDVVPEKDFLKYCIPHFKDPKVFAVSFHEPSWSWAKIIWKNGFVKHQPGKKINKPHISAWASGGSAVFRKSIWEELGGFDEIYKPFYWEDIDLGYRAWKRGYKILWEPKAIVHHQHEAIIGKHFSKEYIDFISERNRLFLIWKNIIDCRLFFRHILNLFFRLRNPGYIKVIFAAFVKMPLLMLKRIKEKREAVLSDSQIFAKFRDEK